MCILQCWTLLSNGGESSFPKQLVFMRHCGFVSKSTSDILSTSLNEGFFPISVRGLKVKLSETKKPVNVFVPVWCRTQGFNTQLQKRNRCNDREMSGKFEKITRRRFKLFINHGSYCY